MKNLGSLVNNPCYAIIWKYKIKPGKLLEFEYDRNGSWQKLFNKSKFYRGSFLFKKKVDSDTYYLLDVWDGQILYENFLKKNKKAYNHLCYTFEKLYDSEEKIEIYHAIF